MKKIAVLFGCLLCAYGELSAQNFTLTCDTSNMFNNKTPFLEFYNQENVFDDYRAQKILAKKGNSFETTVQLTKPLFIQLVNMQLLALPNQHLTGNYSGMFTDGEERFVPGDSNNINTVLLTTQKTIAGIHSLYNKLTSFNRFLTLYDSLKNYVDGVIDFLIMPSSKIKYQLSNEALSALRQYYNMKMAHFLMLPVLYKAPHTEKLFELVRHDIHPYEPVYWLQTEPGRIFLATYFTRHLVTQNNYNLDQSIKASGFQLTTDLTNFLSFHYYQLMFNNEKVISKPDSIIKAFTKFKSSSSFSKEEIAKLEELGLKMELQDKNVTDLFSSQLLVNDKGLPLTTEQKEALIKNKGRIIIDYWASWCQPCIEKISALRSDEIIIKGEKYKLLFISQDEHPQQWLAKKYPALNAGNSFRITSLENPSLYTACNIKDIPRLIFIENGVLKNQFFLF